MMSVEPSWKEWIAGRSKWEIMQQVRCNSFATALSVKDMQNVVVECRIPMTKCAYQVYGRDGNAVRRGEFVFPGEGVHRYTLQEVLPLDELLPYETEDAEYEIRTQITLACGDVIDKWFPFQCHLCTGKAATEVPEKNLRQKLAELPIAKPGMTEEELRQICLEYIRLEAEFPFKFEEDFEYVILSQNRPRTLLGGQVYGGIPYVSRGAGNLYRLAEIYDPETGVLNRNSDVFDDIRYFGNACSGAASMAWARVVTSAYLGYSMFMTEANGFLPVGPYRYPKDNVTMFVRGDSERVGCDTICDMNGEQTMFESYALMKPADGVTCCGHVRMNSAVPVVVRGEDGSIDGNKSYTLMREQVAYPSHINHLRVAPDGTHYSAHGAVDIAYTFNELYKEKYIPFTFAEFIDPGRVEAARIRLALEPTLQERVLTANYPISDVFAERNGKRYVYRNLEFFRKEVKLGDIFPDEALGEGTRIFCQLYNGQMLEVQQ